MIYNENEFKYFIKITQPDNYEIIKNTTNLNIKESFNVKTNIFKTLEITGFNIIEHKKFILYITINFENYLTFIRKLKITNLIYV